MSDSKMTGVKSASPQWQSTACILCPSNCGLQVQVEDGHLEKIRGDKKHPFSRGYHCQKALRLDYYQNGNGRITKPLRRRKDGSFEEISWEVAIAEVAAGLKGLRDTHGGHCLAYYGGGGQGNHLGGAHASTLRAAMDTSYLYSSLAQEKTGGFWVNGRLFGCQTCHPAEDVEHSDFVLFIGTNPWQSHGFPRARTVLKEITRDPERIRGLVVDSSNPLLTAADTRAYRKAFSKLDLLVVIDITMTETRGGGATTLTEHSRSTRRTPIVLAWQTTEKPSASHRGARSRCACRSPTRCRKAWSRCRTATG